MYKQNQTTVLQERALPDVTEILRTCISTLRDKRACNNEDIDNDTLYRYILVHCIIYNIYRKRERERERVIEDDRILRARSSGSTDLCRYTCVYIDIISLSLSLYNTYIYIYIHRERGTVAIRTSADLHVLRPALRALICAAISFYLSLSLYIYIYIYVYIHMHIHIIRMCIYIYIYIYICIHVLNPAPMALIPHGRRSYLSYIICIHKYYIRVYYIILHHIILCIYIYIYVYIYIYMYTYTHVYIYIYIYIYT